MSIAIVECIGISELWEQHGVARRYASLSLAQVAEATRLYRSGLSLVAVGNALGVNHSTVWLTLKRAGVSLRDCQGEEQA